ncbi:MAG: TerB N-terminal domain-containing protein [archaeon]|nr:TerB N-terminal domain-containing protein [archaeon]
MYISADDIPSKDSYDQVLAHADERGTEHPYEPCKVRALNYDTMSTGMKLYYFWWRTCLFEGKYLKTDNQYMTLFVYESLVLGYDPHVVLDALKAADENSWVAPAFLHYVTMDLCICKGLPIPQWIFFADDGLKHYLTGVRLASPIRFNSHLVHMIGEPYFERNPGDRARLNLMMNHALRAIDEYLLQTTGRDFVSMYSEKEERFVYQPFIYFGSLPECRPVVLRYPVFANAAHNVFKGIHAYCRKKLFGEGPRVPSDFPKEYRALIDALPQSLSEWDLPGTALNVEEYNDTSEVGLVRPLLEYRSTHVSGMFKEDLKANWDVSEEGPLEYVSSVFWNPDYSSLSPEAKRYYLYWRTCLRRGRYLPTDSGYLWLYCCDLINSPCPHEETMGALYRLVETYGTGLSHSEKNTWTFNRYHIRKVCLDYALFYGLPISDVELYPCPLSDCLTFERFLETGETPPTEAFLIEMADLKANQSGAVDRDVTAITNRILFRLEKESEKGLFSDGGACTKNYKRKLFEDVEFYCFKNRPHSVNMSPMDVFTEGYWRESIRGLLLSVVAHVRLHRGTSKKKPEHCRGFGRDLYVIIDEEVEKYFRPTPVVKEVHLDLSKVDDAQKGLDEVTDMLAVPEQEQAVIEEPVKPKRGRPKNVKAVEPAPVEKAPAAETAVGDTVGPADGPDLKSRLDEFQTEYLRALTEEPATCACILRLSKMSRGRMEDSINAVAIEVLGDTLLDGGEIVEEYLDTVKGLFR